MNVHCDNCNHYGKQGNTVREYIVLGIKRLLCRKCAERMGALK